jgi:hypothetical protein
MEFELFTYQKRQIEKLSATLLNENREFASEISKILRQGKQDIISLND